jgi:hypothetical protein
VFAITVVVVMVVVMMVLVLVVLVVVMTNVVIMVMVVVEPRQCVYEVGLPQRACSHKRSSPVILRARR